MNQLIRFLLLCVAAIPLAQAGLSEEQAPEAPEFSQQNPAAWIQSEPLKMGDLRGEVVLIEFWTYGCVSCVRSIPWVKSLEERHRGKGFRVIGVHTPEFAHERDAAAVAKRMEQLGIRHAVMLDNDYVYWNAMGNRYWPAFYLIDKHGHVRDAYAGEISAGSGRAKQIEMMIDSLLAEDE